MPAIVPTIGFCAALGIGLLVGLIAGLSGGTAPALLGANDFFGDSSSDHAANNVPSTNQGDVLGSAEDCVDGVAFGSQPAGPVEFPFCGLGLADGDFLALNDAENSLQLAVSTNGQRIATTYHDGFLSMNLTSRGPAGIIMRTPVSVSLDAGETFEEFTPPNTRCWTDSSVFANVYLAGEPDIEYTKTGFILQAFTGFPRLLRQPPTQYPNLPAYTLSVDNGKTWPIRRAFVDPKPGSSIEAPRITVGQKDVHVAFIDTSCARGPSDTSPTSTNQMTSYYTRSRSNGVQFSEPVVSMNLVAFAGGCRYIMLRSDVLEITESHLVSVGEVFDRPFGRTRLVSAESHDSGRTWTPVRLSQNMGRLCSIGDGQGNAVAGSSLDMDFAYNPSNGYIYGTISELIANEKAFGGFTCATYVALSSDFGATWTFRDVSSPFHGLTAMPAIAVVEHANLVAIQSYTFNFFSPVLDERLQLTFVVDFFTADMKQRVASFPLYSYDGRWARTGRGFSILEDWVDLKYNAATQTVFSVFTGVKNNTVFEQNSAFDGVIPPGVTQLSMGARTRVAKICSQTLQTTIAATEPEPTLVITEATQAAVAAAKIAPHQATPTASSFGGGLSIVSPDSLLQSLENKFGR